MRTTPALLALTLLALAALPGCEPTDAALGACASDAHEPDDELASAVLLEEEVTLERVVCPGERDVFRLPGEGQAEQLEEETVILLWEGEEGDLQVGLLDEDGAPDGPTLEPEPGETRLGGNDCGVARRYVTVEAPEAEVVYLVQYVATLAECEGDR